MRISMIAGVLVAVAVPAVAHAAKGKPSLAEAKKAAQAWIDAALTDDSDDPAAPAAIALTATPFYSVAVVDGPGDTPPCAETTATDAASLGKALVCLRGNAYKDGALKAFGSKDRKDLGGQMRDYVKKLEKVAKNELVIHLDQECAGTYNEVIFGVARGDDGAIKIVGVVSLHGECGE